ncbi:glutathione binding-like protein [Aureimonas altamirensis]|uniref:glutathione binding-like protein n=1 Tax=Aureimonas altamirensis TaxID=370622 RepID=UPI002552E209|nr:glutathione binding-like protein [Aureimonas altamirensis]
MMVDGDWTEHAADVRMQQGQFYRQPSVFRQLANYGAEIARPGRIHLFSSWSCPWSQRAMIARNLTGLHELVSMTSAWGPRIEGYSISHGEPVSVPGVVEEVRFLHEIYKISDPYYTGRVTVPVLWDASKRSILSNESDDIVRWFNDVGRLSGAETDLFPSEYDNEITDFNDKVYNGLANAVYEAGYARRQGVYEAKAKLVASTLIWLDEHFHNREYAVAGKITAADVYLVPCLLRFSAIYEILFKCRLVRIQELKNITRYIGTMISNGSIAETFDLDKAKLGYFLDQEINPSGIVPVGPNDLGW